MLVLLKIFWIIFFNLFTAHLFALGAIAFAVIVTKIFLFNAVEVSRGTNKQTFAFYAVGVGSETNKWTLALNAVKSAGKRTNKLAKLRQQKKY